MRLCGGVFAVSFFFSVSISERVADLVSSCSRRSFFFSFRGSMTDDFSFSCVRCLFPSPVSLVRACVRRGFEMAWIPPRFRIPC